jgi:sarcosine oxidase
VEWIRLAEESMAGWRELESEARASLLGLYGLLELVGEPSQSSRDALQAAGIEHEVLTGEEARRRWPVGVPDGWSVVAQPEAGIVRAGQAWQALVDCAVGRGTRLHEDTKVASLDELEADAVVVTAGSWARELLERHGIALPVLPTRESVCYFRRAGAPLPSVVQLDPETRGHAMYSLHDPVHGVKAGAHHAGPVTDPDEEGAPDPAIVATVVEWVARTYPDVDPTPVGLDTCLYTNTEDERFVLERHGRIVVGSPCSGHGFKFAPAVGSRLADLAAGIL